MRRPQPDSRGTSAASTPGVSAQRRLPRLRSRKARFGALGVIALGVTGGLLAASALAAPTPAPPSVNLKVLLIGSGSADPTTAAWESALSSEGVPYTEVTAGNTGTLGSWTASLPALTNGASVTTGIGNYNGVVIADNPADFATGQLSNLYAYEAQYNVRQLDGSVSGFPSAPPNLGVTNDTTGVAITATSESLTAAGTAALPGLAGSVPFDTGSYAYPATVHCRVAIHLVAELQRRRDESRRRLPAPEHRRPEERPGSRPVLRLQPEPDTVARALARARLTG